MDMKDKNYTTFNNLAPEKQKLILQTAIGEFSTYGYAKASCNRIVKTACISKGSLFQYFGSKEGLYSFICGRFIRKVKDAVKHAAPGDLSFFDLLRGVLVSGTTFIDRYPEYFQLYLKIMFEQEVPGRDAFLRQVRLFSADYFGKACDDAITDGLIRSDISVEMILFSLDATLDKFFLSYAGEGMGGCTLAGLDENTLSQKINELVHILENGLKRKN